MSGRGLHLSNIFSDYLHARFNKVDTCSTECRHTSRCHHRLVEGGRECKSRLAGNCFLKVSGVSYTTVVCTVLGRETMNRFLVGKNNKVDETCRVEATQKPTRARFSRAYFFRLNQSLCAVFAVRHDLHLNCLKNNSDEDYVVEYG